MTHGLTAGQRALLRANLLQQQRGLDAQLQTPLAGGGRVEHTHEVLTQDDDDAPQHLMDREIDMARTDRALHLLGAVSNALKRIDEPSFGLCNECGEGISFDRLKLEPWALRCVACERQRENAQGLAHSASP
jgi:DnaK suppressor protein